MFKQIVICISLTTICTSTTWAQKRSVANEDKELGMEISPNKIQEIADTAKKDSVAPIPVAQFHSTKVAPPTPTREPAFEEPEAIVPQKIVVDVVPTAEPAPPPVSPNLGEMEAPPQPPIPMSDPPMPLTQPTLDPNPVIIENEMTAKGGEPAVAVDAPIAPQTDATVKTETPTDAKFAEMSFEKNEDQTTIDFGRIKLGESRQHLFNFKNTGNEDLEIELISACECTKLDYSRNKIAPGGTGYVQMTFDSYKVVPEGVNRLNEKEMTIILKNIDPKNGYQIVKTLSFKVFVEE